nr:antibiotic biosynthesis monooxygenase [Cryobacterium sp. MLB-32]
MEPDAVFCAPAVLRDILAGPRAFDGCLGVEVLVDAEDPAHLILMERWASAEADADAEYREWRTVAGATELGSLLVSGARVAHVTTASDI